MKNGKSFVERLKEAYEKAKKPLAFILAISLLTLEIISNLSFLPPDIKHALELTLIASFAAIIMEVLFHIYEKVVADKGHLKVIKPNDLYDEILSLVKTEKKVNIQCIGVAGRYGWYSVLSRLLDKSNDDSLHEANQFTVDLALISPTFYEENKKLLERFDAVLPVIEDIKRTQDKLTKMYSTDEKKKINLYFYDHLPNVVGFLVNEKYLFLNLCFWEELDNSELFFRGGGTEYLVYDKNDEFGGSRYIERFAGWFNYIKKCSEKKPNE
jgi:hypothetical protein